MKISPREAARKFADDCFPRASVVILAGSVVQGGATASSDLDIVVIDDSQPAPFRRTYRAYGWTIEAFVLTRATYPEFFAESYNSAVPTLQRMCAEGEVIRDDGLSEQIVREAKRDLEGGPMPWSQQEIDMARYAITEYIDDLAGSGKREEDLCTAAKLVHAVPEFVLRTNGRWIGDGKWMIRCLRSLDEALCDRWVAALETFYATGSKKELIDEVDRILRPFGGRLSEGFALYNSLYMPEDDASE